MHNQFFSNWTPFALVPAYLKWRAVCSARTFALSGGPMRAHTFTKSMLLLLPFIIIFFFVLFNQTWQLPFKIESYKRWDLYESHCHLSIFYFKNWIELPPVLRQPIIRFNSGHNNIRILKIQQLQLQPFVILFIIYDLICRRKQFSSFKNSLHQRAMCTVASCKTNLVIHLRKL